ncbi:MAG: hypothetical protein Q7J69_04255 [Candidatus Omnitrophota bacterium]|nr:hypothetical protein [Candidatus Omnitrophota bacterium]
MKTYQHKELAAGRWHTLSLNEQLAHIGSEVERALNWKTKNNLDYSRRAAERALELSDLSLASPRKFPQLKEIARLREILADYFYGSNQHHSTEASLRKYFAPFTYAARRHVQAA